MFQARSMKHKEAVFCLNKDIPHADIVMVGWADNCHIVDTQLGGIGGEAWTVWLGNEMRQTENKRPFVRKRADEKIQWDI